MSVSIILLVNTIIMILKVVTNSIDYKQQILSSIVSFLVSLTSLPFPTFISILPHLQI